MEIELEQENIAPFSFSGYSYSVKKIVDFKFETMNLFYREEFKGKLETIRGEL